MTITPTTTAASTRLSRHDAGGLFGQTMGFVALTAACFALGAYIGRDLSSAWAICAFLGSFAALLGLHAAAQRSEQLALGLLFGFGLVLGLAVAPAVVNYLGADSRPVWLAGGATALFLAGFGAAGYATRRDLSALERILFWALIGLIVFAVVLVFVEIPSGSLIYAIAGLVIFAGLTLYDFQRLRVTEDIRTAPLLAASIFLDALNVFFLFLSLFSRGE